VYRDVGAADANEGSNSTGKEAITAARNVVHFILHSFQNEIEKPEIKAKKHFP
jgi:hypothetical protein